MPRKKGTPKTGGRKKGTPNKETALIKDAVLLAAMEAGDKEGMVGYLTKQARENPPAFMRLLGKILPSKVEAAPAPQIIATRVVLTGKT